MELLRYSSGQVDERFCHLSSIEHLIVSMELSVGFLHQWNPEFIMISAMAIQWSLTLRIVRDSSVHNHVLPATVFEKLENSKSILDTVIYDQILQELWISALNKKRSKEPAVSKNSLLNVSWAHFVSRHQWLFRSDFLRSFPLNCRHVHCILWRVRWIIVKRLIICWELRVSKKCIIVCTNLDNFLDLILNRILLWFLLLHLVVLVTHHLISILLVHLISIILLLLKEFIDLILGQWHSISSNILLVWIILLHLNKLINFTNYLHRIAIAVTHKVVIGKLIVDLESSSSSQTTFVVAASASFLPLSSAASSQGPFAFASFSHVLVVAAQLASVVRQLIHQQSRPHSAFVLGSHREVALLAVVIALALRPFRFKLNKKL